ncbi:MAG: elongation factor G [Planctomycetes bacterium]|nr:elongation factor G [Planctomycetota bacterium]
MTLDLSTIRNIGIAAHIDAGKTTTTERILFYTGRTHRMGDVDAGTTTTDFDEQEQTRGITIYSAAVSCPWQGHTINLIDTPGHVDFTAEVERSLRVLDGMVAVFDAKEGVEAQSETVWRQADRYEIPRICFINKMDRMGADFFRCVASIRECFKVRPLPLQVPIGEGNELQGLIDLVEFKAYYFKGEAQGATFEIREVPGEMADEAEDYRRRLIETAAEFCDDLMTKYLDDAAIEPQDLRKAVREATIARRLFPVLCGSSLRYIGVQPLLDAVCAYLPSPLDAPPITAEDCNTPGKQHTLHCDPSEPFAGMVFKVVAEKPVDLFYLRVYSGTLKANSRPLNTHTGGKENVSRLYRMFAKRRDQIDEAVAGEIVAVIGPKKSLTGNTLCDPRRPVVLEPIKFPETVLSVSIEARSSRDRDKLADALTALTRQDPTLSVRTDSETGQTLLSGMGELHLEVMVHRLRHEMNVDAAVGKPRVSYRETVSTTAEADGRFTRNIGGRDHFAVVRLRLGPRPRDDAKQSFEIVNELDKERVEPEYIAAVESGIADAAASGVLGGYPVIDWVVTIVGAEQHERDSSEMAFENAARAAFYEAMRAANPRLLQPIMAVEIVTSDEYFGSIMGDLNTRQAVVRDTIVRGEDRVISVDVPLVQMFGYVTKLRSLSQGRATSSMTPSHYAPVSPAEMKILVG